MHPDIMELNRREAVSQVLRSALSPEQHTLALRLYDEAFSEVDRTSLNDFCQWLYKILPDVQLPHATRLALLRALRRPVQAQKDGRDQARTTTRPLDKSVLGNDVASRPASRDDKVADEQDLAARYLSHYAKLSRPPRKQLRLEGWYEQVDNIQYQGKMIVENLSRSGAGLRLFGPHTLEVDSDVFLKFKLDDPDQTEIEGLATVRHMTGDIIGVKLAVSGFLQRILLNYVEAKSSQST